MRHMPPLDATLRAHADAAVAIARAGENARLALPVGSTAWRELHIPRIELLYELAYLRVFVEWELFLEQVLVRLLCGYRTAAGAPLLKPGSAFVKTLAAAEASLLGNRQYLLWHDPAKALARAGTRLSNSSFQTVVGSNTARLEHFAAIRHRIAHGQEDARAKLDAATMQLTARRYPGSRAGKFLRDWDSTVTPRVRWLESIANELSGLAAQIV